MNRKNCFIEKIKIYAAEQGEKTALTCFDSDGAEENISYSGFYQNIIKMKNALKNNNVQSGQRCIVIYEDNEIDYITALIAVNACGAVAVPVKIGSADYEFTNCRFIAEDTDSDFIIAGKSACILKDMFSNINVINVKSLTATDAIDDSVTDSSYMMILYTSGSTDKPKGIPYKTKNICNLLENYGKLNNRNKNSVTMCCLPLNHTFALITMVFVSLWTGGRTILIKPDTFALNPVIWFKNISEYRVTHTGCPNFMLSMLAETANNIDNSIDINCLESLIIAAEFIQPDTVKKFTSAVSAYGFNENSLMANYGLTETCSSISTTEFKAGMHTAYINENGELNESGDGKPVYSVGHMIDGNEVIIIDTENGKPVENGKIGEVCLSGSSVLENYWKFNADESFIVTGEKRYFKTGDLGFVLNHGKDELFIYGRIKEIINIKGENYSPYFIESVAESVTGNSGKAVAFSVPSNHTEELVILIEESQKISDDDRKLLFDKIKSLLVKKLSVSLKSVVFSESDSFIKTQNGKLQRNKMRNLYMNGEWNGTEITSGVNSDEDIKEFIIGFISKYSSITPEKIDTSVPMVYLGLNSLLSQLLIAEIKEHYGINLSVVDINQSIDAISEYVTSKSDIVSENILSSAKKTTDDKIPLTDVQQAYITGRNAEIDWGGVPCQCYIERDIKNLDIEQFKIAVKKLMERHESLHTVIMPDFTQKIIEDYNADITFQKAVGDSCNEILEHTRNEMCNTMLPVNKPMFKIVISEMNNNIFRIHIQIDMICCDAMSIFIFWNDLKKFYNNETPDKLSLDFFDYQTNYDIEKKEKDKQYWTEKLKNFPSAPELPWNPKADKVSAGAFSRRQFFIDNEKWNSFERLMEELGITPTVAFLTLFAETLSAFGAGAEFVLSLTTLGRKPISKDIYNVIGDFTKLMMFAVRCKRKSLLENALSIQFDIMTDLEHTDFTSIDIARELEREESEIYPVVFTSLLGMEKIIGQESPFSPDSFSQSSTPQVILDNQLLPTENGIIVCWDAIEKAFADGILDKMFEVYSGLIEKAFDKEFWTKEIRDLRPDYDRKIQNSMNNTVDTSIPFMNMTEGFISQAETNPDRTAVIHNGINYSYSDLRKRADQISEMLQDNNVAVGDRVMIQMHKSFDLIAAIVGTVQYGAVYLPMPYDQPQSRQSEIYRKSGAKCIIADNENEISKEIPLLTTKDADKKSGLWNRNKTDSNQLAYIIYTSGSTGTPKGVAIRHNSAMNTILSVNKYLNLNENDCLIGLSSVSFDLSVYDIFGAFTAGASLLVPTEAERIDPACWITLCETNNVTIWNTVPALMDILLDYCIAMNKVPSRLKIRNVILSGDWIPMELFGKFKKVISGANLTSMGGATEASIWSNYFPVKEIKDNWVSIPYGYPLPNQIFHVIDDFDRLCPCGVSGKLYIGGRGIADSYYNEKELTENAFIIHPDTGERLYNTGDYGRYDENGCLIFMGRKDTQVKINGYRIELGEIQNALDKIGYENNTVIVTDDGNGGKKLIAFVKTSDTFNEADIKNSVSEHLPRYFIPDRIIAVNDMPITANGKIDKKSLLTHYQKISRNQNNITENDDFLSENDIMILELLKKEFNIPQLSSNDSLMGLGITSLSLIKLSSTLETAFGYRDNINNIIRYKKVSDFLNYYKNTNIDDIQKKIDEENAENLRNAIELAKKDPLYNHPVMQIIREELQMINISPDDQLVNLGLSSLSVIRIANKLENLYSCRPSVNEMLSYQIVRDLIEFYDNVNDKSIAEIQRKIDEENAERLKTEYELAKSDPMYNHPVMKIIREELQILKISPDDQLVNLGLSSLSVIRIANKLESHYGRRPSVHEMLRYQKVNDIIDFYDNTDIDSMNSMTDTENNEAEFENMPVVLKCICEVLNVRNINPADSFSGLGISSLEIIRIANKLESIYEKRPSVQELAEMSSIQELIDYYDGTEIREQEETQEDIDRKTAISLYNHCRDSDIIIWPEDGKLRFKAPHGSLTPEFKKKLSDNKEILLQYLSERDSVTSQDLTPLQMAYVIGRQNQYVLGDITAHYYVEYSAENLNITALQDAVNELIIKNEILRTVITPEGRMNVYKTNPGYTVEIVECDENNIPERDLRTEMKDHQFILGEWSMFDIKVTKYNNNEYRIHIGIDCLILDGWSINMFLKQLISAYVGNPVEVTDYTFRLYLEEERQWLRNKQYHRESQKYWTSQIDKLPPAPHLPLKNRLEDIKKPSFKRKQFLMSEEYTFSFFQKLKKYDLTPSTALCTAYMMSLSKYSENPDVTLNLTMFNRQPIHPDVQQVLGDFTNIALIGYHASDKKISFIEHTAPVSKELWNAIEYRSFNVINLLGQLAENYNDVIAAPYVFTSLLDKEGEKGGDIMKKVGFTEIFAQTQTPQVVLDHQLYLTNGRLLLVLDYVEQAFDDNMLSAIFKDYTDRVERLAANENWEEIYD